MKDYAVELILVGAVVLLFLAAMTVSTIIELNEPDCVIERAVLIEKWPEGHN